MLRRNKAVVCFSGGADSTTVLYLAMNEAEVVHALSVDYGQRHKKELEVAKEITKMMKIPHVVVRVPLDMFGGSPLTDKNTGVPTQDDKKQGVTVVPFRNTLIATLAAAYARVHGLNTIYMGPTHEDLAEYPDCLMPGTFVETPQGVKSIEDVRVDDYVYTEKGKQKVLETSETNYTGDVIGIQPVGLPLRYYTPNHPLMISLDGKLVEKLAKDIQDTDLVYYPILNTIEDVESIKISDFVDLPHNDNNEVWHRNKASAIPNEILIDDIFLRLLGLYIAEGSSSGGIISYGLHENETDYIAFIKQALKTIFNKDSENSPHRGQPNYHGYELVCNSIVLQHFFRQLVGHGAANKRIPEFCMTLPHEKQKVLVQAIFDGDGNKKELSIDLASPHLVYQLRQLLGRLKIRSRIRYTTSSLTENPLYLLRTVLSDWWHRRREFKTSSSFVNDGLIIKIRALTKTSYTGKVHSLEVENTHTFINEGVLVHNCRPVFFDSLNETLMLGDKIHDLIVRTPFIGSTKSMVVHTGLRLGVDYSKTWTCYLGGDYPCLKCDACRERMLAFRLNNMKDPLVKNEDWANYLTEKIGGKNGTTD